MEKGYITKPIIHLIYPNSYENDQNYDSVENLSKLIIDAYKVHKGEIIKKSHSKNIKPKLLVKCPSVDKMWDMFNYISSNFKEAAVCAGASRNPYNKTYNHFIGEKGIKDRSKYLSVLKTLDKEAIVLHYDTMSEGINVSSFTGTAFLTDSLPTLTKVAQNIGRSTRLDPRDRIKIRNKEIDTSDYSKWEKPNNYVLFPVWDDRSDFNSKSIAKIVKGLRDDYGFDPTFFISIGNDIAKVKPEDPMDEMNEPNRRNKPFRLINEIKHIIEDIDKEDLYKKEKQKLNSTSKINILKEFL